MKKVISKIMDLIKKHKYPSKISLFIETDCLILRLFALDDFEDYYEYIMDDDLQKMLGVQYIKNRDFAYENFSWLIKNRDFIAVQNKKTGKVMGHIAIHPPYEKVEENPIYKNKNGASLSFALSKNEQRKGYMFEALTEIICFLFKDRKLDYIDCEYESFNIASQQIQKKLGFKYLCTEKFDDIVMNINVLENKEKRQVLNNGA